MEKHGIRALRAFSHHVIRHAGIIAIVGTLLAVLGGYFTVELYKNLRTDLEELLPSTARSVIDLNEITHRLESIDNLAVLITSDDTVQSKRFVIDLAKQLETEPKDVISSVEYKITAELAFFKERQALYLDVNDLLKIRNYVRDRLDYERDLYNPLNIFRGEEIPEPQLDFNKLREKYNQRTSTFERFPGGFYATPDGKKRVVLVYLPGKTSSISKVHALKHAVESAIEFLGPKNYAEDLRVQYTGGVQDTIEEHAALIADLELSTIVVSFIVTLAMILFFRNFRATMALVGSLFMGTFWTFGISYFAVGYLNANSAFLGSIVIGNGINCGIIFLARYLEERRKGHFNTRAVRLAITQTATATWTAALAAALAYGSLVLTGFRGFRQFGIIGLIGMVLCWISAYTLLPAYLTVFDRMRTLAKRGQGRTKPPFVATAVARFVARFPTQIAGFSLALSIAAASTLPRISRDMLQTDLTKLRNKESLEHGSAYLSRYIDEIFQRYLSPLVLLPPTHEQAQRIAATIRADKEREGPSSMIASVQTIDDFLPTEQVRKLEILAEIRKLLPPRLVARLSHEDQDKVAVLLKSDHLREVTKSSLPDLILRKFTEKNGTVGSLVLVEPPLGVTGTASGTKLIDFIRELREAADRVAPGTPIAGALPIVSDMLEAITRDGPRATLFALLAVMLLVVALFRSPRVILFTLFALFMGVLWLGGIILGFGLKINFLNFIALPITFGIGVDYGVNIFQRYREEGERDILKVIRDTGGAVALCSFTTITGYTSLLIAGNQGFVSFGTLAVAGELTCVFAAIVALPAFLMLRKAR